MSSEEKSKRRKVRAVERDARDFQLTLDECERFKPQSSNIVEVAWRKCFGHGTLYVNFNSSPDWYEYQNVERFIWDGLLESESPGRYLREKVFGNDYYATTKLVLTEGLIVDEPEPRDDGFGWKDENGEVSLPPAKDPEHDEAHVAEAKTE